MFDIRSVPNVCPSTQRGATVWLTGLPSAGKSTIAHGCEPELRARGLRVEVLDGDAVRRHLAAARGYSRADRAINIQQIGWVAELLARNGVLVLVSAIASHRVVVPATGRARPAPCSSTAWSTSPTGCVRRWVPVEGWPWSSPAPWAGLRSSRSRRSPRTASAPSRWSAPR